MINDSQNSVIIIHLGGGIELCFEMPKVLLKARSSNSYSFSHTYIWVNGNG